MCITILLYRWICGRLSFQDGSHMVWSSQLESYLVEKPEDRFSHDEVQLIIGCRILRTSSFIVLPQFENTENRQPFHDIFLNKSNYGGSSTTYNVRSTTYNVDSMTYNVDTQELDFLVHIKTLWHSMGRQLKGYRPLKRDHLRTENSRQQHLSRLMTKPTMWPVRPVKTRISLGICPQSSLSAWKSLGP